jgi:hypothetical protein
MTFKLNVEKTQRSNTDGGKTRDIDFDALNEHIVTQCKAPLAKPRSIPGYISGIIDLGIQKQDAYEGPVEAGRNYPKEAEFYTEGGKPFVRYERKPVQQVALTVDFPQIQVDYAKFFSDTSDPKPMRFLLNGEFSVRDGDRYVKIVGRGFALSETKHDDGTWAFAKNSQLFKLAAAAGVLRDNGHFKAEDVGNLLGQVCQFEISAFLKENNGKRFLNERIKLAGVVPEGIAIPELDSNLLYGVNVNGDNDPEVIKRLRLAIKNTIRRATNYRGSKIQELLDGETTSPAEPEEKPAPPKGKEPDIDFSDDLPF